MLFEKHPMEKDGYGARRRWANKFLPAQFDALSKCFNVPISQIKIAHDYIDMNEATDAVIDTRRIALRVRRPEHAARYSDQFTIRTQRDCKGVSEWEKVQAGKVHFMLYAFADSGRGLQSWVLVDLSKLTERAVGRAYDGGEFLAFNLSDCAEAIVRRGSTTATKKKRKAKPKKVSARERKEAETLLRDARDAWERLNEEAAT